MIAFIQKLKNKKNKKGFTLVELIVVIAIIAILTAVLIPVIGNYTAQAQTAANEQQVKEIETTINTAITDAGTNGSTIATGTTTVVITTTGSGCDAPVWTGGSNPGFTGGTYTNTNFASDMNIKLATAPAGTITVTFAALASGDVVMTDTVFLAA